MRNCLLQLATVVSLITLSCLVVLGQSPGRLNGTIRVASGAPVGGVTVIATNQVTRKWKRTRSGSDGRYSLQLASGAYRMKVGPPNVALFDKDKTYGDFAIVKGDTLENVIIEPGKDTTIDIPLGPAQDDKQQQQQRATPDRWRIEFPEYDRYGDRGARGRDIPFQERTLVGSL